MLTNQLGHACCQIMTKANCLATRQSCLSIVIILKAMQTNFGNFYFRWRIIKTDTLVPFRQQNVRPSGPNVWPTFRPFWAIFGDLPRAEAKRHRCFNPLNTTVIPTSITTSITELTLFHLFVFFEHLPSLLHQTTITIFTQRQHWSASHAFADQLLQDCCKRHP